MRHLLLALSMGFWAQANLDADLPPLEDQSHFVCCHELKPAVEPDPIRILTKRELVNAIFDAELIERLWLADYQALESAFENGELVDLPNDPEKYGFVIRTWGQHAIAQKEDKPELKPLLMRLRPAAVELLISVALEYKEQALANGLVWKPLEITSLARSWTYQVRLCKTNKNACTVLQKIHPTHVFGLGLDFGRANLPGPNDRLLRSILIRREAQKQLVHFVEGATQAAYHLFPRPQYLETLAEAFRIRNAIAAVAEQQH
jgi:hypothetical protein